MSLIVLSLAEIKSFLQIGHTKEDTILQIIGEAVEEWTQEVTAIQFAAVEGDLDQDEKLPGGEKNLRPTKHPVLNVSRITDQIVSEVVPASDYSFNDMRIWLKNECNFWAAGSDRFRVEYTAGYLKADVPTGLKLIMLQVCHRMYNKRGDIESDGAFTFREKWSNLFEGDIAQMLEPYSFRSVFS
jgi:hypothetical protein